LLFSPTLSSTLIDVDHIVVEKTFVECRLYLSRFFLNHSGISSKKI